MNIWNMQCLSKFPQKKVTVFFCRTNELFRSNCKLLLAAIFLKLGFTPWKAEQSLKDSFKKNVLKH